MASNNWGVMEDFEVIEKPTKRLTSKWTKTTTEAFGDNIHTQNGNRAEEIILKHFQKIYDFAHRNEEDRDLQLDGKDITFGSNSWSRSYNVDVKSNLKNYQFIVDIPKLFKSKADRWLHLDLDTMWYVMYDIHDMRQHIVNMGSRDKPFEAFSTSKSERPSFVRMGQVDNA